MRPLRENPTLAELFLVSNNPGTTHNDTRPKSGGPEDVWLEQFRVAVNYLSTLNDADERCALRDAALGFLHSAQGMISEYDRSVRLGVLEIACGNPVLALRWALAAERLANSPAQIRKSLINQADAHFMMGDHEAAYSAASRSLEVARLNNDVTEAVLLGVAVSAYRTGRPSLCEECVMELVRNHGASLVDTLSCPNEPFTQLSAEPLFAQHLAALR